jgi:signal transduction histidine kinase/ActR/RegA family two-component response regulator/HPt (histidine-containing phosphotransfer) domain-containing protein
VFRDSVARQVLTIQGIAVGVIFVVSLGFAAYAWNANVRAGRVADLVDLDRTLFGSTAGVRLEIGTVGVALLRDDDARPGLDKGLGTMAAAHRRAERGLRGSGLPDAADLVARLHAAAVDFEAARHWVDAEAALPRHEREAARTEPWRMAVYRLAATIDDTATSVGRELRAFDPAIGELVAIRQMSFTIRDRYSRQCSAFRPAVQTDTPLTPADHDRWREDIGAYTALWTQMRRVADQLPASMGFAPLVAEGMVRTEAAQAVMTRTLENLSGSGLPAYDAAGWSENCITAYDSILGIGRHALDLEVAHAAERRADAFAIGAGATAFLALVMVLGIGSLRFVRRRLSAPMRLIVEALTRLRAGDLDTPVTVPPWKDEPGRIAEALEGFRLEAVEARRLRMRIDELRDELVEHAERVGRAKSQFLATMSHEIRTPLHGILGITQLLARSRVSDEQRVWVTALDRSGRLLRDILDDILDFTRLESGRVSVETAPFSLRERIAMVEAAIRPVVDQKGLSFDVDCPQDLPDVLVGDAGKLGQILLNLLGNAAKFTSRGGIRLAITREGAEAERLVLVFAVVDTGIGIAPEAQARIFEPFLQADGSVARRFGGSGLGLAVCRGLLEVLGGDIRLDSELGRGTTFTVRFPVAVGEGAEPIHPVDEEDLPPLHLLVAEDNPVNALIVRTMLEREGHRVEWVETGEAALAAAIRTDFDVILMDLAMPGMDGVTACREIRACGHATRAVVPILAVSAGGSSASDVDAGFDGRLEKPFRREDLLAALAEAIGLRPRRGPGRRESLGAIGEQARDLGVEGARKLVTLYLSSQPKILAETVEAGRRGDRDLARALAHRLRGAAAHVGAADLADLGAAVERAAAAGNADDLATAADALSRAGEAHFRDFSQRAEIELARFAGRDQATFSAKT